MSDMAKISAALSQPFDPSTIKWRLGQTFQRNGEWRGTALAYIDARHVMDRLDQVVGPHGWQTTIDEKPSGRVLCSMGVKYGDEWVFKTDGAGNTDIEGDKGGISDAIKRAAVQHGIGRYLYGMGVTVVRVEGGFEQGNKLKGGRIPRGEYQRLERAIREQFAGRHEEARKLLETVDEGNSEATKQDMAEQGHTDLAGNCQTLLNDWDARIRDSGVVDDLRDIHAEMNMHREAFKASADLAKSFKAVVKLLTDRKAAIEANDGVQQEAS